MSVSLPVSASVFSYKSEIHTIVSGQYYRYEQQVMYLIVILSRTSGVGELGLGCSLLVGHGNSKT